MARPAGTLLSIVISGVISGVISAVASGVVSAVAFGVALRVAFGVVVLLPGCAAQVAQASFPARPDTVVPGDLLGPYSGQVIDAASGNPVPDALVYCSWAYQTSPNLLTPTFARDATTNTKADGSYQIDKIPAADQIGQGAALLRRFTLIVYKAGYRGYRSDLRSDDGSPRHDFAQRDAKIRLERLSEGESHAKNLAFLGGGAPVRRAAQAEIIQAGLELTDASAPKTEVPAAPALPPLPAADTLLTLDDLRALTGTKLAFEAAAMPDSLGAPEGADYQSTHYKATGKDETFDAALRLWRLPPPKAGTGTAAAATSAPAPAAAEALYDKLHGSLIRPQDKNEIGDRSLRAYDPKRRIRGAAALLREAGLVVELSCGASLCGKDDQAARLLSRAVARLLAGPPNAPAEQKTSPELKLPPLRLDPH